MSYFDDTGAATSRARALLAEGFADLPESEATALDASALDALQETARRLQDNYPYQHPLYVGQMLKPPHPVAREAYALAMLINPNNHALDGGRASSQMEREAVAELATMVGFERHLGHLCGGGTMANFEALWVGREEAKARAPVGAAERAGGIAASSQAHYTHERLSAVLGVPFECIATDARGRLDVQALERVLTARKAAGSPIGTVVVTLGSTAVGAVDPLPQVLALRERHGFRVHVDAAYGGYFRLASQLAPEVAMAFEAACDADSLAIDPHKHGLQPYGCGCVLFRDPAVGRHYRHDSPYTYFTDSALHLGEISLECSRAGAAAVALWATQRALPLVRGGEFAASLDDCLIAARSFHDWCQHQPHLVPLFEPELDIVNVALRAPAADESTALAQRVFDAAARRDLHLALARIPRRLADATGAVDEWGDAQSLTCLRLCTMKPAHRMWMDEICERLADAIAEVQSA